MKLIILNALICDIESELNGKYCDLMIKDGVLQAIELSKKKAFDTMPKEYKRFDAKKALLSQAWVDMYANFGEPGFEEAENFISGSNAAIRGGFSKVMLSPLTQPKRDSKSGIQNVLNQSKSLPINLYPYGCVSVKSAGKELAEMFDMQQAGAIGFTDGANSIEDAGLLLKALLYLKGLNNTRLLTYANDAGLSNGQKINEGEQSTYLGMKGSPSLAEEIRIQRDLELVKYANASIHFNQISCKHSVDLIRKAKKQGITVSCDVAIANLCFTDLELNTFDSNFKVIPPLRTKIDQKALWDGIADGTIDAIVSNHTPIETEFKNLEYEYATHGMNTLEAFFPMLVHSKPEQIDWALVMKALSANPSHILGLEKGEFQIGKPISFTIADPNQASNFSIQYSKTKNNPLHKQAVKGNVLAVYHKQKLNLF
jgi:dihydroorotase